MIYKISIALLMPMLIIAFFLGLAGVQQIELGNSYYEFIRNVSSRFNDWKFEIPKLRMVEGFSETNIADSDGILKALKLIGNFFVTLFNGAIALINIIVTFINVVVHIVQFVVTIITEVSNFITRNSISMFIGARTIV